MRKQLTLFDKSTSTGLAELEQEILNCRSCRLREGCTQVVCGEGNPRARLIFVGEAPGAEEDRQGIPFVGAAGNLLNKILSAAGIQREEVYITNIIKCRPPNNRTPTTDEIAVCYPHLEGQLNIIRPEIIVCLGAVAARTLIDHRVRITRVRGKWHEKNGIKIMATFHPAALLRNPAYKRPAWDDFREIARVYRSLLR